MTTSELGKADTTGPDNNIISQKDRLEMEINTLSRKERRAISTKTKKAYGLGGDVGIRVHQAYQALERADVQTAAEIASSLTEELPDNPHPYIVLGTAALSQRAGEDAQAFFSYAVQVAPKNAVAHAGLGKALVLQADVFEAVKVMQTAIDLGSKDVTLARLYSDLMVRMGRIKPLGDGLTIMAGNTKDADLYLKAGEIYTSGEFFSDAIVQFEKAYKLNPKRDPFRLGLLKARMFAHRYEEARDLGEELAAKGYDEAVVILMNIYRVLGNTERSLDLLEGHAFNDMSHYQRALAVKANIHQDMADTENAIDAYEEASALSAKDDETIARAYGSFNLRARNLDKGLDLFAKRQPASNRKHIPYENSSAENLQALDKLVIFEEQGVGDQLALIGLAGPVAKHFGINDVWFVSEQRVCDLVKNNTLGVNCISHEEFDSGGLTAAPEQLVFLADLCRHMEVVGDLHNLNTNGFLVPDADDILKLSEKYEAKAGGRPIYGLSWKSAGTLSGYVRSVELKGILSQLPEDACVVNLQYGDIEKEWKAAKKAFPGMVFIDDADINQLTDMKSFAAQVAALPEVITIDNTIAHVAGALGHPKTTVFVPNGSECMWYWGLKGGDAWYGNLNVMRPEKGRSVKDIRISVTD
jgi:tetratricopeptide (TPR) repeat protein